MSKIVKIFSFLSQISLTWPCSLETHPFTITIRLAWRNLPQICGGSLLHQKWAMTAAHCVFDLEDATVLTVMAQLEPDTYKTIRVKEAFISDYYDPKTMENDFCLLYLTTDFPDDIKFGKIPGANFTESCYSENVRMMGWVMNRYKAKGNELMTPFCLNVKLMEAKVCKHLYQADAELDGFLCSTHGDNGEQPCRGDSGGPLICKGVTIGLISWGLDCALLYKPTILSRVDKYIGFVNDTIQKKNYSLTGSRVSGKQVYTISSGRVSPKNMFLILILSLTSIK